MKAVRKLELTSTWYNYQLGSLLGDRWRVSARGKSGQYRVGQPLTAAGGNPRESATETIPPVIG